MTTNGILLYWATEVAENAVPTTGWKIIPNILNIPAIGGEPDTIEKTPISETEYKQYDEGLKETGSIQLRANFEDDFIDAWDEVRTAYATAKATKKKICFSALLPDYEKAFFFSGKPGTIPFPDTESNQLFEATPSITISRVYGWQEKPTISQAAAFKMVRNDNTEE